VAALNTVQSQLSQVGDKNGVSRRRVRELKLELESCKADVARERTRVLEREEALAHKPWPARGSRRRTWTRSRRRARRRHNVCSP
jgi:hypothetical protein